MTAPNLTWTLATGTNSTAQFRKICGARDGSVMFAAVHLTDGSGSKGPAYSTNGGQDWTFVPLPSNPSVVWSIHCSANGKYVWILVDPATSTAIYQSSDYGITWTANTGAGAAVVAAGFTYGGYNLRVSDDGQVIVVANPKTGATVVPYSVNGGSTWSTFACASVAYATILSPNGTSVRGVMKFPGDILASISGGTFTDQAGPGSRSWGDSSVSAQDAIWSADSSVVAMQADSTSGWYSTDHLTSVTAMSLATGSAPLAFYRGTSKMISGISGGTTIQLSDDLGATAGVTQTSIPTTNTNLQDAWATDDGSILAVAAIAGNGGNASYGGVYRASDPAPPGILINHRHRVARAAHVPQEIYNW